MGIKEVSNASKGFELHMKATPVYGQYGTALGLSVPVPGFNLFTGVIGGAVVGVGGFVVGELATVGRTLAAAAGITDGGWEAGALGDMHKEMREKGVVGFYQSTWNEIAGEILE